MWNRTLVKSEAKTRLRQYYWMALLVCLLGNLISEAAGGLTRSISITSDLDFGSIEELLYSPVFWGLFSAVGVIGGLVMLVAQMLLANPISMGRRRYFLESREHKAVFERLFYAFNAGGYQNVVKVLFLRDLRLFLWKMLNQVPLLVLLMVLFAIEGSFLRVELMAAALFLGILSGGYLLVLLLGGILIAVLTGAFSMITFSQLFLLGVPIALLLFLVFSILPIIKGYEYKMIPYLLAERPDLSAQRAFELSRMMTKGEKWKMFVLDLSFIGWYLLGLLVCCVGTLAVQPYIEATYAEVYTALREKAFGLGFSDRSELPGFMQ